MLLLAYIVQPASYKYMYVYCEGGLQEGSGQQIGSQIPEKPPQLWENFGADAGYGIGRGKIPVWSSTVTVIVIQV